VGEGGEFYRPMAVAIIGGTITSTLLTLLVVPTFYDSIEISKDRFFAKYHRRAERRFAAIAMALTLGEAFLTITGVRFIYRKVVNLYNRARGRTPVIVRNASPSVSAIATAVNRRSALRWNFAKKRSLEISIES